MHRFKIAQRLKKVQGAQKLQLWLLSPYSAFSIFELQQHDIPQKITFSMKIYDFENESIV